MPQPVEQAKNVPGMRYLWLFFLMLLLSPALSEPWYDELLFEYRREGTLLDFQQESDDKYQAVVAYPLWKIVGGMESVVRSKGWVEDFTLQPDFAVLRTPLTKLGEYRRQVVLLAYSIDRRRTRLHFVVEGSPQSAHFEMLAMGLTACRYFEQPERYLQVVEHAQTSTRLSTDPPFPFPPSSVVEAPEAVRLSLDPDGRPHYIVAQLEVLQNLRKQQKVSDSEFEILKAGLSRAR